MEARLPKRASGTEGVPAIAAEPADDPSRVRRLLETPAASERGRSLAQEVEDRISRSFNRDEIDRRFYGDEDTQLFVAMVTNAVNLVQRKSGLRFTEDQGTYENVCRAIAQVVAMVPLHLRW